VIFVVGSGPAGISCAQGLLAAGAEVTLLDSGHTLEPSRLTQITDLAKSPPERWDKEQIAFMKEGIDASAAGIPLKLAYGSDFPYRPAHGATPVSYENSDLKPSYAQGGLSTVW